MTRHVPVFQQELDETDQGLRLFWIDIDNQIDVRLHVSPNIADASDTVNRTPSAYVDHPLQSLDLIN